MFKLVVLFTLVAIATAAPGFLHAVPVATSHQQRVDIIESRPVLKEVVTPIEIIAHNSEEESHSYDHLLGDAAHVYDHLLGESSHEDIHISPSIGTVQISVPESVKVVSSHQELHQVHDTPVHVPEEEVQIVEISPNFEHDTPIIVSADEDFHQALNPAVSFIESAENLHDIHDSPIIQSIPVLSVEDDVHQVISPVISSIESVESHHEIHDSPVYSVESVVSPVVVSHGIDHQISHGLPASVVKTSLSDVHVW